MKKIINAAWDLESLDINKLAKYMRCLFQVAMTDNMSVAEELLDQVEAHAADCAEVRYLTLTVEQKLILEDRPAIPI